jgi:deoxyribodipyrimidine photo-lyase
MVQQRRKISQMNLVWLKKDLRVFDNQALLEAVQNGPTFCLFVIEPEWLQSAEFSNFHFQFAMDSLHDLFKDLQGLGLPLLIREGKIIDVLSLLKKTHPFKQIYSHQETGLDWTYQRDLAVKTWCADQGVPWHEYQSFAILRGLKDRNHWNGLRKKIIQRPTHSRPSTQPRPFQGIDENYFSQQPKVKSSGQKGGRRVGVNLLNSFLSQRGQNYRFEMSSPLTAFDSCSRLSPHITWGTLSLTEIQKSLSSAREELSMQPPNKQKAWRQSLRSFESRLWWHCHFIQKLETEPEIEFHNMNRGFDGMREDRFNASFFEAWKAGETGFPFVDACMRALKKEGWINFRMRAMLISFASYQLWLHWKPTATFLAQQFVDFEPGIHFSQVQMQSGVTGINSIRIYSALKQGMHYDPQGEFIKEHCPELEGVDATLYPRALTKCLHLIAQMSGVKLGENITPTPSSIIKRPTIKPNKKFSSGAKKKRSVAWPNKSTSSMEVEKTSSSLLKGEALFPNQTRSEHEPHN